MLRPPGYASDRAVGLAPYAALAEATLWLIALGILAFAVLGYVAWRASSPSSWC